MRNMLPPVSTTLGLAMAVFASDPCTAAQPTLKTLVSFNGDDGSQPLGGLVGDGNGNLYGTTSQGGAQGVGTVFEIAKTFSGYASTPTILYNFDTTHGANPMAGLTIDANGNLFGTTFYGGGFNKGTVFELAKTSQGYASALNIIANAGYYSAANPEAPVIIDANGNLFGTTSQGGPSNNGLVFELTPQPNTNPTAFIFATVVNFNGSNAIPQAGLFLDADGNLIGTTNAGGLNNNGTVFEIAKTGTGYTGYSNTITPLAFFMGSDGSRPTSNLIADADGNLFGTTSEGGTNNGGTLFEIAKTPQGYATTPTILVSFGDTDTGSTPNGLIMDAAGNLFGTTTYLGPGGQGTVFELAKTPQGYAAKPTILVNFNHTNGARPNGPLLADGNGNLFGTTTQGGAQVLNGTVFEITNSGFVTNTLFAGKPGKGNCYGESVLALLHADLNLDIAAQARGLADAGALQVAILHHCKRSVR
jgi:uncharacterized repeat protein (TIGR03803 family)